MHNTLMPFVAMTLQWQKDKPGEDAMPFQCAEEPLWLIYQQGKSGYNKYCGPHYWAYFYTK